MYVGRAIKVMNSLSRDCALIKAEVKFIKLLMGERSYILY